MRVLTLVLLILTATVARADGPSYTMHLQLCSLPSGECSDPGEHPHRFPTMAECEATIPDARVSVAIELMRRGIDPRLAQINLHCEAAL